MRYRPAARWFHTATYLLTFALLGTGWWLRSGQEGHASIVARTLGVADVEIHRRAGWALTALMVAGITLGFRAAVTFVRETARVDRGDRRWLRRWPAGARHGEVRAPPRGHFDPGQRLANLGFVAALGTLIVTGIGLTTVHGGPRFVLLAQLHRGATYALTALVIAHVLLAAGILPGYRGAWRAMHLRGRTPVTTVRRLWPATAQAPGDEDPPGTP